MGARRLAGGRKAWGISSPYVPHRSTKPCIILQMRGNRRGEGQEEETPFCRRSEALGADNRCLEGCARGGTRTLTSSRTTDFESVASAKFRHAGKRMGKGKQGVPRRPPVSEKFQFVAGRSGSRPHGGGNVIGKSPSSFHRCVTSRRLVAAWGEASSPSLPASPPPAPPAAPKLLTFPPPLSRTRSGPGRRPRSTI